MRRLLLPALLLLPLPVPSARATMVTGYAMGRVGINRSSSWSPDFPAYVFTPGEQVYLTFQYDDGLDPLLDPDRAGAEVSTSTGYSASTPYMHRNSGSAIFFEGGVLARLLLTDSQERDFTMRFAGDTVQLHYFDTSPAGGDGFDAVLTLVDGPEAFTAPEPSSLTLGLVGAALAGVGWMRRRDA